MQFRDRGQRDDRRRRVLGEEHRSVSALAAPPKGPAVDAALSQKTDGKARFALSALPQNQRPITDLIPSRWPMIGLLVLVGVLAITLVEGAHYYLPQTVPEAVGRSIAIRLTGWLSSTFATLAAAMSLLVYAVRRHQVDDYNGRYRIWIWAAALWMLLAASRVAGLDELGRLLLIHATGWTGPAGGAVWAITPVCGIVLLMGVRLLFDMRGSRLSTAVLLAAGGLATASIVMANDWIVVAGPGTSIMIHSGLSMLAYLLLLVSTSLHGRHLLRDAQGLVPVRPAKPAKAVKTKKAKITKEATTEAKVSSRLSKSKSAAKPKQAETIRTDLDPQAVSRDRQSTATSTTSPAEDKPQRKLSKSERRRLRKQKRRALNDAA